MKDYPMLNDQERYRIGNRITWITIAINIVLAVIKVASGILFHSTAILADGIHTISDVGSSIGIIIGFFIAKKPEDLEHPYGHEKAESIAGFVLAIFFTGVGFKIGYDALSSLISGKTSVPGALAIWVATGSIFIKELQFRIAMYGGKKINSNALIADAWHHRSDAFSSIAALIGIVGARLGYGFLDPLAGFIVAVIVVKVGIDLFIQGYNDLMDSSIETDILKDLKKDLITHPDVKQIQQLRTRKHGPKVFMDVKVCVNSYITVQKGHMISKELENRIYHHISNVKEVMIYVNPCAHNHQEPCSSCSDKAKIYSKETTVL